MQYEFNEKLIKIGKIEDCNFEDILYFIPNYPSFNYSEPIFNLKNAEIDSLPQDSLIYFIKGLHIVEITFSKFIGTEYGFGSPGQTYPLLQKLNRENYILLYDWMASKGGNFFITSNISYDQNKRNKIDKLQRLQQVHDEAVASRSTRMQLRIEEHSKRHDKNCALRNAELERLRGLSKIQQLKTILASEHPLDYYPEEFSKVTGDLVLELNSIERDVLNIKLEKIKQKSWWQKIKLEMQNWEA